MSLSITAVAPSTSAASFTNPTEPEEESIEFEVGECSIPPPAQQISERLEHVLEVQVNYLTAWGSWMTSTLGNVHDEVWPSFKQ